MTHSNFIKMIAQAESSQQSMAVGDNGLAGGMYQMHWPWREDYWQSWMWETLSVLDAWALDYFLTYDRNGQKRGPMTARQAADLFNEGHSVKDPAYDVRCLEALAVLGIGADQYDTLME